jgi:hypothetical protein
VPTATTDALTRAMVSGGWAVAGAEASSKPVVMQRHRESVFSTEQVSLIWAERGAPAGTGSLKPGHYRKRDGTRRHRVVRTS